MQRKDLIASLEGMRAFAVLAVLLFHLDLAGFDGGYLGVDVFFVISGFIITRNLLAQRERGDLKLSDFYYARFRRLVPALSVVTLLTLAAAVAVMPPADLAAAGESALYTVLSLSNVLFWWQADYFDAASHSKPFLHTWSLGVEEQFYLVWPVVLLALARARLAVIGCAALAAASFGAGLWLAGDHASAVFYLSPFRVYQFMAGAIVAVAGWNWRGTVAGGAHLAALAAFAATVTLFGGDTPTLVAGGSAAAASLLMILTRDTAPAARLTGHPLLVWIGQRSYAIYLVHWPLVVLWKYRSGTELAPLEQALLGAASIVAAMALHRYVEQPFRRRGPVDTARAARAATPVTVMILLVAMFVGGNLAGHDGFPDRVPEDVQRAIRRAEIAFDERLELVRARRCHADSGFEQANYDERLCAPLAPRRTNVLVIGDSVAADIYLVLKAAYPDVVFSQATGGSCPALELTNKYRGCLDLNRFRFDVLAARDYDYVVLAGKWRPSHLPRLEAAVARLRAAGRKVVVFGPGVRYREHMVRTLGLSSSLADARRRLAEAEERPVDFNRSLREALDGVSYVDWLGVQCGKQCEAIFKGEPLYIDEFHLTPAGAERLGRRLASREPALFGRRAAGDAAGDAAGTPAR